MVSGLLGRLGGLIADTVFECRYGQPNISFINPDSQVAERIADKAKQLGAKSIIVYMGSGLRGRTMDLYDFSPKIIGESKRVDFYNNSANEPPIPVVRLSSRTHISFSSGED